MTIPPPDEVRTWAAELRAFRRAVTNAVIAAAQANPTGLDVRQIVVVVRPTEAPDGTPTLDGNAAVEVVEPEWLASNQLPTGRIDLAALIRRQKR